MEEQQLDQPLPSRPIATTSKHKLTFFGVVIPPPSALALISKKSQANLLLHDLSVTTSATPSLTTNTSSSYSGTESLSPDSYYSGNHQPSPELRAPEDDEAEISYHPVLDHIYDSTIPSKRISPKPIKNSLLPPVDSASSPVSSVITLSSDKEDDADVPLAQKFTQSVVPKKALVSTCHYDKIRCIRPRMTCSEPTCNTIWCNRCIANHFTGPKHPPFVANGSFLCPLCRDVCTCAKCRRLRAAGISTLPAARRVNKMGPTSRTKRVRVEPDSSEDDDEDEEENTIIITSSINKRKSFNSNSISSAIASGSSSTLDMPPPHTSEPSTSAAPIRRVSSREEGTSKGKGGKGKTPTTLHKIMEENIRAYKERNSFLPASELGKRSRNISCSASSISRGFSPGVSSVSDVDAEGELEDDAEEEAFDILDLEMRVEAKEEDEDMFTLLPYESLAYPGDGGMEAEAVDWELHMMLDDEMLGFPRGQNQSPVFKEGPRRKRRRLLREERLAGGLSIGDSGMSEEEDEYDSLEIMGGGHFADLAAKELGCVSSHLSKSSLARFSLPIQPSISPALLQPPQETSHEFPAFVAPYTETLSFPHPPILSHNANATPQADSLYHPSPMIQKVVKPQLESEQAQLGQEEKFPSPQAPQVPLEPIPKCSPQPGPKRVFKSVGERRRAALSSNECPFSRPAPPKLNPPSVPPTPLKATRAVEFDAGQVEGLEVEAEDAEISQPDLPSTCACSSSSAAVSTFSPHSIQPYSLPYEHDFPQYGFVPRFW